MFLNVNHYKHIITWESSLANIYLTSKSIFLIFLLFLDSWYSKSSFENNVFLTCSSLRGLNMMTLDISFADIVSPDTVTMLGHPQLAVLPVCADTSLPQDLHLTLIGSIYQIPITYTLLLYIIVLSVYTPSFSNLPYIEMLCLYSIKKWPQLTGSL